ncbi:MAG TPA: ComEC/Rec2 family competence protein [Elusimicrobiota bacterium]|nr:ComEC/Rec2 family competence protein [Elusimicrobiota bacterium]
MPPCYLRRSLFLVLGAYIAALCALRAAGFFAVHPDPKIAAATGRRVIMDAEVLSAPGEDYRGIKIEASMRSLNGVPVAAQRTLVYFPWFFAREKFLRPGETARFFGRLEAPKSARNPGGFDEQAFLAERGICWVFWAEDFERLPGPVSRVRLPSYWAQTLREKMQDGYFKTLDAQKAHVLSGLMFGDKGRLSPALRAAIQDAGVMHLLVPSGAKVALVILAAVWLLSWLGASRAARFFGSALAAGFYTVMVGASAPYARAYCCALAYYAAVLLDRDTGGFQGLVLSAWVILLLDPRSLFSPGFVMTYLAMLGLSAADAWSGHLAPAFNARLPSLISRILRNAAATLTVELMLWPVFAGVFGRASVLGSAANLVLIPCAAWLMAGGFLLGSAFLLRCELLVHATAWVMTRALGAFCRACFVFSALPFSSASLYSMRGCSIAAYYAAVGALLFDWSKTTRVVILSAAAGILVFGAAWDAASAPSLRAAYLWPARSGLGVIEAPGRTVAFGVGAPGKSLEDLMRAYRIRRIDEIVLGSETSASAEVSWRARFPGIPLRRASGFWRICAADACAGVEPASFQAGRRQFDIIASLLKGRAVEIEIHGHAIGFKDAFGKTADILGRPFLQ